MSRRCSASTSATTSARGGAGTRSASKAADAIIATVDSHAPGFAKSVIGRQIHSPLDLERRFGLIGGDIFHGKMGLDQLFSARPMIGAADYRMPLKGLYLCGSGAHPGGGVTGAPGHNAAHAVLADRRFWRRAALKPLEGIKVLDLSRVLAGPWCTQLLADLGAEVIKIERPGSGDDTRHWGPPWHGEGERPGRGLFPELQPRQEVGGDRFRARRRARRWCASWPPTPTSSSRISRSAGLAKFGLDAATLRAANPRLVYASITGFGQDGPYADRAGYDFIIQGMGGMMSITGLPDGEPGGGPMRVGVAIADLFTGMYTCGRDPRGALSAREDRRGRAHRHGAVRHAAGDARQPGVERAGFGQGPAAAGQHAPEHRALSAVRRGGSADHHRRRQRPPVRPAGGDLRPSRMGRATSASRPTARASPIAARSCGWSARCIRTRSRRRNGSSSWKQPGIPAGPINRVTQALADVQAQHRAMVRTIAGVPLVGSPVRLDGARADSRPAAAGAGRAYGRGAGWIARRRRAGSTSRVGGDWLTGSSPSRSDGEGDHAQHGGGVSGASAFYPSTIPSAGNGSPPHELRSQGGTYWSIFSRP